MRTLKKTRELIKLIFKRKKETIPINVLTRTSNRPNGFKKCHDSLLNQTYKNYLHIVSYDSKKDLKYLEGEKIKKICVKPEKDEPQFKPEASVMLEYKPYNLYCNDLLQQVKDGWIMFLDDDDMLAEKNVLKKLVSHIKECDEDTLLLWQARFPNGDLIPPVYTFEKEEIKLSHIDTACFIFHSKYKDRVKWDCWTAADYRFIRNLSGIIPNQLWIPKTFTLKNNFGDHGSRNDIPC